MVCGGDGPGGSAGLVAQRRAAGPQFLPLVLVVCFLHLGTVGATWGLGITRRCTCQVESPAARQVAPSHQRAHDRSAHVVPAIGRQRPAFQKGLGDGSRAAIGGPLH